MNEVNRSFVFSLMSESERISVKQWFFEYLAKGLNTNCANTIFGGARDYWNKKSIHIETAIIWAAFSPNNSSVIAHLYNDYPLARLFLDTPYLNVQERITWIETTLKAAERLHRLKDQAICLMGLGINYLALEDYQKAKEHLIRALAIFRGEVHTFSGGICDEGRCLGYIGKCYSKMDPYTALAYYNRALVIARGLADLVGESIQLFSFAIEKVRMGYPSQANKYIREFEKVKRKIKSRELRKCFDQLDKQLYDELINSTIPERA
ncbi:MAG: tetratricopeptide repeat protein [Acidobacteriota bacterium]